MIKIKINKWYRSKHTAQISMHRKIKKALDLIPRAFALIISVCCMCYITYRTYLCASGKQRPLFYAKGVVNIGICYKKRHCLSSGVFAFVESRGIEPRSGNRTLSLLRAQSAGRTAVFLPPCYRRQFMASISTVKVPELPCSSAIQASLLMTFSTTPKT